MRYLRSTLSRKALLLLVLLGLGGSILALAATSSGTGTQSLAEVGTEAEQEAVRTSRETSTLPLRSACTVVPAKELFITDVSVVDDCWRTTWTGTCPVPTVLPATRGAWTFGGLMPGLFKTNDPAVLSDNVLRWLREWETDRLINGDTVPARPLVDDLIIQPWLAASGGTRLDMTKAPFRLLAIVSRLDLRQNSGYSGGTTAGEGRFVFGLLINGQPVEFFVILEYGLDAGDCAAVQSWAQSWHALGTQALGDPYNAALQGVTDRFTAINASPNKPNGSAINQVRSNDFRLEFLWELREFRLNPRLAVPVEEVELKALPAPTTPPAPLLQTTVAQTPARNRHQTAQLASYVNTNAAAILAHTHVVPLSWSSQTFRGGASPHSLELGWDGPPPSCTSIADPEARHAFSLDTCSGCHGDETGIFFRHVAPRGPGVPSALSSFLTGGSATDICGRSHNFGDIERRRVDLCQLLEKTCLQIDAEPVVTFVH